MITVDEIVEKAYEKSTTQIDRIIVDNQSYRITNVQYDDDCYEDGNIFGTAIARALEFEVENIVDLEKKEFEYQTGIYINGEVKWITLGNFITQDLTPNDTTGIVKVNAMDYMLKSNIEYKSVLDYNSKKITILDVMQEACNQAGLGLATTDFANCNFIVDSNQFEEGTLIRQVFKAVAQISGTFAKIRNDNKVHLITPKRKGLLVKEVHVLTVEELNDMLVEDLAGCENQYPANTYKELVLKRNTHPINLVSLGMADIEGENIVLRNEKSIEENGENSLIINDNPFAYTQEKREQLITALFDAVNNFEYTAYEIQGQAKPFQETGDEIVILDKKGNSYNSFLFRFNYKSPNGLESTMEAPSIIKATVEYQNIPSALDVAKKTERKVDKQEQKITDIAQEQTDTSKKVTEHSQTIEEIKQSVSSVETEVTDLTKQSIVSVDVEYALGTSATVAPTENWSTKAPEWENNKYMWQRTVTTYADKTQETSEATCISGAKGQDGKNGTNGANGKDGVGIKSTIIEYQVSDSGTETPTGIWLKTVPDVSEGMFLWTRTKLTYTDEQEAISYSVARAGINGISLYTWLKYADTPTTGMSDSPEGKTYMGLAYNKTTQVESKNYNDYTWSLIKGEDGIPGTPGEDGKTTYTWVKYATSNTGANMSDSPEGKSYIGLAYNKTTATESNKASDYTWSLIKGEDGVGVEKTEVTYQVSSNGTTIPTDTWQTTIPEVEDGQYLWTRTIITYTDKSNSTSYSISKMGQNGTNGENGEDGIGVREIEEEYYLSTSDKDQIGGSWKSTQDMWTSGKYIWTRSKITWTNNDITYTTPVLATGINNANNTAFDAKDIADKTNNNLANNYYTITETNAQISTKADSITAEVNKTISTAKQDAINSANTETDKKLENYTVTEKMGTVIEQNYEHVKVAWNQISEFIQMMIINGNASLAILDKNKDIIMALDKTGQDFYDLGQKFGEMGTERDETDKYIAFSVDGEYDSSINSGMAWGVKTKSDNKFFPILYIKNFTVPPKNSDGARGELVLDNCNLMFGSAGAGISTGTVRMFGDPTSGIIYFEDVNTGEILFTISPEFNGNYPSIGILNDTIRFFRNMAGSNSLKIGTGTERYCLLTDDGELTATELTLYDGYNIRTIWANGECHGEFIFNTVPKYNGYKLVYGESENAYFLKWTGSQLEFWVDHTNVGTLSDKRLKTEIKDIDEDFIKAIKELEMKQFKVANRNGLTSFGILAQDLIEIFKKYNKNPFDYEIVYKTKYKKNDDTVYYGINYEQFLLLKSKAQEIEIQELQKENKESKKIMQDLLKRIELLERRQ